MGSVWVFSDGILLNQLLGLYNLACVFVYNKDSTNFLKMFKLKVEFCFILTVAQTNWITVHTFTPEIAKKLAWSLFLSWLKRATGDFFRPNVPRATFFGDWGAFKQKAFLKLLRNHRVAERREKTGRTFEKSTVRLQMFFVVCGFILGKVRAA